MNTEEDRLAAWLRDSTPEPPGGIALDALERRTSSRRRWLPVLAAAAIVVIAVVALGVARSTPDSEPTTTPLATRTQPPDTGHPSRALPVPAWDARRFVALSDATPVAGANGSVYVGVPTGLLRLDAETGTQRAAAALHDWYDRTAVVAGESIWLATGDPTGTAQLRAFDLDTLHPTHTIDLATHAPGNTHIATDDADVVAATGQRVVVVDAGSGHVLFSAHVPGLGANGAAGVAIDENTIYATGNGVIVTIDRSSGRQQREPYPDDVVGLIPATAGRWLFTASGMGQHISFEKSAGPATEIGSGGGGYEATMTRIGDTVWIGGSSRVVCADAETGAVRASADITSHGLVREDIHDIVRVDGRTFAAAQSTTAGSELVRLDPPATCGD